MENDKVHITPYGVYKVVLVILLFLTAITILVTWFDAGSLAVAIALGVASIKATLVLLYFMHLKFDHWLIKVFVAMVFLLLVLVFIITFFDYLFR